VISVAERVRVSLRHRAARARQSAISRRVQDEHLTYLTSPALLDLEQCVKRAPHGDLIECGVALGGSAIVLASHADAGRQFHGYDVFGMIPPPGPDDPPEVHERYRVIAAGGSEGIAGDAYYGYRDDLYNDVVRAFERHGLQVGGEGIQLHRGLFEETLHPQRPIAVAHIDCDWYEPVKLCLERIWPHLVPGGFVICDDYYDWDGARKAVDEFLAANPALRSAGFGTDHLVLKRSR
jgi:O-methyltransferase